ncbi:N-acetyltransferase family protein [Methylibium sp.]|uniref:GNAT family N-acetyltransferase n=1 Tax=Methylibium sp. TaxID=2067992 RepID=UPI003D0A6E50
MDLTIRVARLSDVPRLLELYKQLDIASETEMPIEHAWARFLDLASNPLHCIYVAEVQEKVVGTVSMVFVGGISHGARDSCIVEDVVVSPELQGAGIGGQMMRFAMDVCAARDCYKLVLSSHVNREKAHRFYEGLGFRKHGYSYLIDTGGDSAGASPHGIRHA